MKLALIVHSSSYDRLHLMVTLMVTAVALKREVIVFLTYAPLKRFVEGTLDGAAAQLDDVEVNEQYQQNMESGKIPKISELLEGARNLGTVKIFGCSQSTQVLNFTPEQLTKLDAVTGYATFLQAAQDSQLLVL